MADDPTTTEPDAKADDQADEAEAQAELDSLDLKWLAAVVLVFEELRCFDVGGKLSAEHTLLNPRALHARDMAQVALCERLERIARRDQED